MGYKARGSEQLLVVDLGVGMAAALAAKVFADFGARVVRLEPSTGDPFYEIYPAYRAWRADAELADEVDVSSMLQRADVCIVGGEDFPNLTHRYSGEHLSALYADLIVLDFGSACVEQSAYRPAVDILAQARTGLVSEQFSARPICFAVPLPTYGAVLLGLLGVWTMLIRRRRTGRGELVRSSLEQGVGLFWSAFWMRAESPDQAFSSLTPKNTPHLIFRCADGGYIQIVMGIPGAVAKLYQVLGISGAPCQLDRGGPKLGASAENYFGDLKLIAAHVIKMERAHLLDALWAVGLAAEPVLSPGECWNDPQVVSVGIITTDRLGWRRVGRPFDLVRPTLPVMGPEVAPSPEASGQPTGLPLAGLRIVDLGNFVAGPFASRLLGDLGADVIKVQAPSGSTTISGFRTIYTSNCNKRGLCLDLKTDDGLEILLRMCTTADAVHHNFRIGVAERLGVAPSQLREANPVLVTLETTAYGKDGPKRYHSGFDMVMQALCGHEARAGGEGNAPMWSRSPVIDFAAGALGAIATLMAIYDSKVNNCGVEVTVSLLASAMFLQSELVCTPENNFVGAPLLNQEQTGFHPAESLYETRSGWLAVAARDDAMAARFAEALGLGELPRSRATWGGAERRRIAECIRDWDRSALIDALRQANVWAEICVGDEPGAESTPGSDALVRHIVAVDDNRYGQITGLLGSLIEFGNTPMNNEHLKSAPTTGEHTHELLLELGYTTDEIADLLKRGVAIASESPRLAR